MNFRKNLFEVLYSFDILFSQFHDLLYKKSRNFLSYFLIIIKLVLNLVFHIRKRKNLIQEIMYEFEIIKK